MLVSFSKNPFRSALGVVTYNWGRILAFALIAATAYVVHDVLEYEDVSLPVVPVTVVGGGLAIFLGFRNNSAYDRWWEARKIWGGIVNYSRTFGMQVNSYAGINDTGEVPHPSAVEAWKKSMIYRHIAWLTALRIHLRKEDSWEEIEKWLDPEEYKKLLTMANKPSQLINIQGLHLKQAFDDQIIENFRHISLSDSLKEFYNLQGKAERIKNTVFPYYYNFFTNLFCWLFIICLPFALVEDMGWSTIPMSVAISFVFSILDKAGNITEEPFEGRAADTPMSTIVRAIEIDLLQMLETGEIPEPMQMETGKFGVTFFR